MCPTCSCLIFWSANLEKCTENGQYMYVRIIMCHLSFWLWCSGGCNNVTMLHVRWLQKELACVMVKLGCVSGAVQVYERLEMWEEVVRCYAAAGRKGKAEQVARERLAQRETPPMWCLLGEVMGDPGCYRKAWELSGERSFQAQKGLGLLYLRQEKVS